MSSDEKALKKIEKLEPILGNFGEVMAATQLDIFKKINELIDAHNELLDTHTVKEAKGCVGHEGGVCEGHIVNNKVKVCSNHEGGSHFECKACIQAHILSHTVKEEKYCNEENCTAKDDLIPHEHVKEEPTTPEKSFALGEEPVLNEVMRTPSLDVEYEMDLPEKKCSHPKFCECPCMRGNDFTPLPLGKNWKDGLKPQKL